MEDVSPHERRNIETFSFLYRLSTGAKKPPKQTIEEHHVYEECDGEIWVTTRTTVRHQHPADEWAIPSLLPLSVNGSFT